MLWVIKSLALASAVAAAVTPQSVEDLPSPRTLARPAPLLTTNHTLLTSLKRISDGSPLWRDAMQAVRRTGRHVLVLTPADLVATASKGDRYVLEDGVLAEAIPILSEESQISSVVVVVNLRLVQRVHDARVSVLRDFEADLDRILVHEVYGHAVPYLLTGNMSGRCADPRKGEDASDACSIRRENAVRAELGLGRRADAGLYSLTLAMGTR